MPQASLSITLPDGTWIHDVTTSSPAATVRVLAGMPGDGVGFALLEVTAPDLDPVLDAMADHDGLSDVDPLQRADHRIVLQIETPTPLVLTTMQAAGIPVEPPVTITDGVAALEVRTSHERLSTLGEQLDRFGLTYTVEAIRDGPDTDSLLSDHQAALLRTAVECGYYDTPRTCSLTDLADERDIAKSTCSETLHRAESHVIRQFVETHHATDPTATNDATDRRTDHAHRDATERPTSDAGSPQPHRDDASHPSPRS